jgi:hypothetical protein
MSLVHLFMVLLLHTKRSLLYEPCSLVHGSAVTYKEESFV